MKMHAYLIYKQVFNDDGGMIGVEYFKELVETGNGGQRIEMSSDLSDAEIYFSAKPAFDDADYLGLLVQRVEILDEDA